MGDNKNKTVRAVIVKKIWNSAFFFFFLGLTLSFKYGLICSYPVERDQSVLSQAKSKLLTL